MGERYERPSVGVLARLYDRLRGLEGDRPGDPGVQFRLMVIRGLEVTFLMLLYQKDGNPLLAWKARRICREMGEPTPPWVEVALDAAGDALLGLDPGEFKHQAPDKLPRAIAAAVGLSGRGAGSKLRKARDIMRQFNAVYDYSQVRASSTYNEAVASVADKHHVSERTLRRWIKDHGESVERIERMGGFRGLRE